MKRYTRILTTGAFSLSIGIAGSSIHAQQNGPWVPQQQQQQPPQQQQQWGPQGGAPVAPRNPAPPPFQLTPQEKADLDQALQAWEQESGKITSFEGPFTHWVYDATFFPPQPGKDPIARRIGQGDLKYVAPDKGLIDETQAQLITLDQATRQFKKVKLAHGEHWACDGTKIYSVDHEHKTVQETILPPEMRGQKIMEGPLPFAFGTNADKLRARYFLRLITPQEFVKDQVWLEIRPRFQHDAANFSKVQVILRKPDMFPSAIAIYVSENDWEVYQFEKKNFFATFAGSVAGVVEKLIPFGPDTFAPSPAGYKHTVNAPPIQGPQPGGNGVPPGANPPGGPQAQRSTPFYR